MGNHLAKKELQRWFSRTKDLSLHDRITLRGRTGYVLHLLKLQEVRDEMDYFRVLSKSYVHQSAIDRKCNKFADYGRN